MSAKEAYKAYVRAYDSHHLKIIFDVNTLDLANVALSFGFTVPPAVDLRILFLYLLSTVLINTNNILDILFRTVQFCRYLSS